MHNATWRRIEMGREMHQRKTREPKRERARNSQTKRNADDTNLEDLVNLQQTLGFSQLVNTPVLSIVAARTFEKIKSTKMLSDTPMQSAEPHSISNCRQVLLQSID